MPHSCYPSAQTVVRVCCRAARRLNCVASATLVFPVFVVPRSGFILCIGFMLITVRWNPANGPMSGAGLIGSCVLSCFAQLCLAEGLVIAFRVQCAQCSPCAA
jgi:hypothetical protein